MPQPAATLGGGEGGLPLDLQEQLLAWYRNTCLVAGAALVGSVCHWNFGDKSKAEVFVPPRAHSLPPEVVEGWKRSMRFREGVRTVGRQTVFATGVAALYFGVELSAFRLRGADDWRNSAAAAAAAGGYLGSLLPGPSRVRGAVVGAAAGGALGASSGLAQQQLRGLLPEGEGSRWPQGPQPLPAKQQAAAAGASAREQPEPTPPAQLPPALASIDARQQGQGQPQQPSAATGAWWRPFSRNPP